MALTEQRSVSQITHLPEHNAFNVQWVNQISRDGEVISRTYERKAYTQEQKSEFLAEVDGGQAHATAVGW